MAKCDICKDTGWTGWHKPMVGADGVERMVFVPQRCSCEIGRKPLQYALRDKK